MGAKIVYFFGQTASRATGWTESFYSSAGTLAQAYQQSEALLPYLMRMHGFQTYNIATRVSMLDNSGFPTRQSQLLEPFQPASSNPAAIISGGGQVISSDYPTTALLLRATTQYHQTRQWIKGVWDVATDNGGIYNPANNGAYATNVGAFESYLSNSSSGIQARHLTAPVTWDRVKTIDWTNERITFYKPHGLTADGKYYLGATRSTTNQKTPNGIWNAIVFDAVTLEFRGLSGFLANDIDWSNAKGHLVSYSLYNAAWRILRSTERKVGSPFGHVIGRRTTR